MYKVILTHTETGETITLQDSLGANMLPNVAELDNNYKRSEMYYGVLKSFGNSLTFYQEGAKFIEKYFQAYGAGTEIEIKMYYDEGGIDWRQWYFGQLNLKTRVKDNIINGDYTITVNITNGDFEEKLITNLDSIYDVSANGDLYEPVLFRKRNSVISGDLISDYTDDFPASSITFPAFGSYYIFYRQMKVNADDRINNIISDISNTNFNNLLGYNIFESAGNCDVRVISHIVVNKNTTGVITGFIKLRAIIYNSDGSYFSGQDLQFGVDYLGDSTIVINDTSNLTLLNNQMLYICVVFSPSSLTVSIDFEECTTDIKITEGVPDSQHYAVNLKTAITELVNQATGQDNRVDSALLDNIEDVITTGELLRVDTGIETPFYSVNTSIEKFFQSLNVSRCLGMGIDSSGFQKRVIFDHRSEFYKPEIIYNIGEVVDFSEEFAPDYIYSQVLMAYPELDNEIINGRYEFNTQIRYTMPTNWNKNILELKSDIRADGAGIDEARRKPFSEMETTDTKFDDVLFFASAYTPTGGDLQTRRDEFINSFSGVPDNTFLYNVTYWMPYALRFWAWWLLSGLRYNLSDTIITGDLKLNSKLIVNDTNLDGEALDVACNYNDSEPDIELKYAYLLKIARLANAFSNARNALFEPIYYNFSAPVTYNFINKFEGNRHGVVQFTFNDVNYYGYAIEVPAVPGKIATFKLLKISKYAMSILT